MGGGTATYKSVKIKVGVGGVNTIKFEIVFQSSASGFLTSPLI